MTSDDDPIYRMCRLNLAVELAHMRLMAAHQRVMDALERHRKAGFDPDQPRGRGWSVDGWRRHLRQ